MVLGHSPFLKRPDDHWQGEEVVVVLYAGGAKSGNTENYSLVIWRHGIGPLSLMICLLKTFENGDFEPETTRG